MNTGLFEEIIKYTPKGAKSFQKNIKSKINSPKDNRLFNYQWSTIIFLLSSIFIYFLFLGRAINIQVSSQEKYVGLANKNRIREFSILAGRGVIYDRNGVVLARNKPLFSLELNTLICENKCEKVVNDLKNYIKISDFERIAKDILVKKSNILIANGLTKDDILKLESNLNDFPGLSIQVSPTRDYIYPIATAHVLGYVGLGDFLTPVIVGKTGIEEYYNQSVSGVSGTQIVQVDSAGTSYKLISVKDSLPGKDIETYLDAGLQTRAYELLQQAITESETGATGGAVVASDPITGGILALVSYPSFDLNKLSFDISPQELAVLNSDPNFPFFNRAIGAVYPPGSTFKMVTAAATLQEGVANEFLTVFDPGYVQVGSFIFRNWKLDGHGEVNIKRALQVSNDTYFYTVGGGHNGVNGLGISKLHKWAKLFGYGMKSGIDLAGEVAGYMPDGTSRDWYLGDDFISAIGQGDILATPLQVNNMTSYFASGGKIYQPKIVKSIDGEVTKNPNLLAENLLNEKNFNIIVEGLNKAVEPGGTAYPLFDFPQRHNGIKLAGKTGTSEYITPNGEENTHAWFTVYAPYKENIQMQKNLTSEDKPIVITVFLEGGGSGSDDAAPLAKELLDYWFN